MRLGLFSPACAPVGAAAQCVGFAAERDESMARTVFGFRTNVEDGFHTAAAGAA